MIQNSQPAPSCPGALRICGLAEGPGRRPSRFSSSALGEFQLHGPRAHLR